VPNIYEELNIELGSAPDFPPIPRHILFTRVDQAPRLRQCRKTRRGTGRCPGGSRPSPGKEAKKGARTAPTLPDKLERQQAVRTLETKRDEAWRAYDQASREVDQQKDSLLDEINSRLEQTLEQKALFTIRWVIN